MAFLGARGEIQVIGLDDADFTTYGADRLPTWPLSFSADGTVIALKVGEARRERSCIVVNGREGPAFEAVGRPAMSRDGRIVAYWATRGDSTFVRIGDREGPPFDFVTDPVVSADGSTVAYAGERDGRWVLRHGERTLPISGKPDRVFLSPDGDRVGWIERLPQPSGGSKMRVVVGDTRGEPFGLVWTPSFSPVEPAVAYAAEDSGRRFLVIGTRKIETTYLVSDPVFSSDGRKIGYGARIGRELWWKVIDVVTHR